MYQYEHLLHNKELMILSVIFEFIIFKYPCIDVLYDILAY